MPQPALHHTPVLLPEVLTQLKLQPGDQVVDATLGGGGHARAILTATAPTGRLLALEADPRTLSATERQLSDLAGRIDFVNANFRDLKKYATQYDYHHVAGALFDLGLASIVLADAARGFSFQNLGPLDMRLDPASQTLTAATIVNTWPESELTKIFHELGEARAANRIAQAVVQRRAVQPLATTIDLAGLITTVVPRRGFLHPATQIFQALRLAVNDELGAFGAVLPQALDILKPGGRLAVISFHSLEDRLVKQWSTSVVRTGQARLVNKHVIVPSRAEVVANPRARSAKLRIIEKNN